MSLFKEIVEFRYSCRRFNDKEISKEDMDTILYAARMAPSSCGMEQYHFVVVESNEAKEKAIEICLNQGAVRTANKLIYVMGIRNEYAGINSERYQKIVEEKYKYLKKTINSDKITYDFVNERMKLFCAKPDNEYLQWSKMNSYLPAMNIMNQAADLKIDSCPLEGFDLEKFANEYKELNKKYELSMVIALGYRDEEQSERLRIDANEIITYI